jgi:hypothetical protein
VSNYLKAIVAVIGAVAVVVQTALSDSTITAEEWGQIATAAIVALGVYLVPNKPAA